MQPVHQQQGCISNTAAPRTSKPASKPPCDPSTSSKAASAAAAPPIMLGTKSRCPGASNRVTCLSR
eukprot:1154747-Pelagomonas_calceolata.AAC.7